MKKILCLGLALGLALTTAGCARLTIFSNYRSLENIELVRTVTVDKEDEGVNVSVYGTAGEQSEARMYERSGPSVGVAMGKLILMPLGREAILSHTEAMLIGEDLAKISILECLDYVERFSEMRLDTGVLVVRDGTARDLLAGLSGSDTPASDTIAGLGRNIARVGEGYFFSAREIASSMADNGCALVQCVRGVKEEKLFEARGDLNLEPAGFAVVKDGAVCQYLSDEETLGVILLLGKYKSRNVDLALPDAAVTVSVDLAKTDMKPVFDRDGRLAELRVKLSLRANVINIAGMVDITDEAVRRTCERELTEIMTGAVRAAIRRSQELKLDYLDLEGVVRRSSPLRLEDMPGTWEDIFPQLSVTVEGSGVLARTYDIADPPELSGKEDKNPWEKLIESLKGN